MRNENRNQVTERSRPKLPVIKLPEFSGDYTKWMFFKDSFETTIHQDQGLTAMRKHQYLIGVLQGEARSVIQGFKISNKNYENAWTLLTETYDNKMMIIQTHLDELLEFPSITKKKKTDSIRQFIWHIQTHISSFKTLLHNLWINGKHPFGQEKVGFYRTARLAESNQRWNVGKYAENDRMSQVSHGSLPHN